MPKKKAKNLPWLLANNPRQDNSCQCFRHTVPDAAWIVVKRYATAEDCATDRDACSALFMQDPIRRDALPRRMMKKKR